MSGVVNTVAEAALNAVAKMKEGAHNLLAGPASALSPRADSQEDVATGVTTKYGFCGLGKDGVLTSVVQKMSVGDKHVSVKLFVPNDQQASISSIGGGLSLQFVDSLDNLFKDSEVIFLAVSGETLEVYAESGLLRNAISVDGPTKAVVVFGDADVSVITAIADELSNFEHIDLLKVTALSSEKISSEKSEKKNGSKQIYCASGSEEVIGKIGDFLNAMGGRPMYVGTNMVDAAKLIKLYAAYESIVAAALFEVCWEAKQLDIDLRNFYRKLPQQRVTSISSAVELADAFVNDPEKLKHIQANLDARLAVARQTLMLKDRAQPVKLQLQSNGTMPATDDVDADDKSKVTKREIVENGVADDEQKPAIDNNNNNKADKKGKSNTTTTAESSRSSSRTRRTGAAVVNDAARVHIMGAEDEDDEDADAGPSQAARGTNSEQQTNGGGGDQQKRGPGRPKREAAEPVKGTRASTRARTNTAESSQPSTTSGSEKTRQADKPTRKAAKGGAADVAVDPSAAKVAEPLPNIAEQHQQQPATASGAGGSAEGSDRKFFKSTGGPAAGKLASAFGKLNETKGGSSDATPKVKAEGAAHAQLSQPPNNADIAGLPELDNTPVDTNAAETPKNTTNAGSGRGKPGRKAGATSSAAEKKKSAQIAQSAKRIKSKQLDATQATASGGSADEEATDDSQKKTPVKAATKRRVDGDAAGGGEGNETDDTANTSSKKQATAKKQTKGGKASSTSGKKKTAAAGSASKKRPADDDDDDEDDDDESGDDDEESSGTESEQRFTLDDAKRETDRGAGWKELPEITTPTNVKYAKNDIVWSKITGYPWWPAQIVGLYQVMGKESPTFEVRVTWLGDNNWSDLKIDQIAPYTEETKSKHDARKKKDKAYQLACIAADLLKATPTMSVVEATDKAKVQYSTKSPTKGKAAAAATASADGADSSSPASSKKTSAKKKIKTETGAADAGRTRESLRRSVREKPTQQAATTVKEESKPDAGKKQQQRATEEDINAEKEKTGSATTNSTSPDDDGEKDAAKSAADDSEATSTSATQSEQNSSSAVANGEKSTTDKKLDSSIVAASDDGEENTSALQIDES